MQRNPLAGNEQGLNGRAHLKAKMVVMKTNRQLFFSLSLIFTTLTYPLQCAEKSDGWLVLSLASIQDFPRK
jgi:hypothetical protein